MSKTQIAKLERVDLREVWRHEARDFTQWLEDNIATLNEALELDLVNVEREQAAGAFSIDLVAEDSGGGTVIIENQLEKSNHDHLGKLITYLSAMDAKAAIWIVSEPRPEHVAAITWLNEGSSAAFYMVKVEAVRIGDSPPAPLFTLIVGPSDEAQDVGTTKKEIAERHSIRKRWWTQLIGRSSKVNRLHAHLSPRDYAWLGASTGTRGLSLNYWVYPEARAVELYIDRGVGAAAENKSVFDQLLRHKAKIEAAVRSPMVWDRLDGKRACRIKLPLDGGGFRMPDDQWPKAQDEAIQAMDRLEKALRPYLAGLKLEG